MRLTPTSAEAAFHAVAFRKDLEAVLKKYGARFVLQKQHGATKMQTKFDLFPTLALTMIELPANAPKGATRRYAMMDATPLETGA